MNDFIDSLVAQGYLRTPEIISSFRRIHRRDFISSALFGEADIDTPLPIGHGQTISQPLTVAFMLELLQPRAGQKILDVGSGSGWTTALLADIVGPGGKVYAMERISELKEFGQANVKKYSFPTVEFFCRDGHDGLPSAAPFDRILVSAAAYEIPPALTEQLKLGGRLVIPTEEHDIRLIVRKKSGGYQEHAYPGFIFVPLVED